MPEGAKEVIARRLARLRPEAVELLKTASVCGRTFRLDVLTELLEAPAARLVGPLEEAMSAGLVVEPEIGRFTYCHALVRETLYAAIASDTSRARLHLAVGEALEAVGGDDAPASELALHFHAARHVGGAEKAVDYGVRAAEVAARALAYEEAARHERQALDALEILARDEERFQELDRLGRLQWQAGDSAAARATFREKAELARRLDDAEQLARAAIGFGGRWYDAENIDEELIALLREARKRLPKGAGPTQAKVIARLAQAVRPADREGEARQLNREALAMARGLDDAQALIDALSGEHTALQHVEHLPERLEVGAEWLDEARGEEHEDALALALCWRAFDLFELGDVQASRAAQQELSELAERLRQPLYRTFATSWEFKWLAAGGRFVGPSARPASAIATRGRRMPPTPTANSRGRSSACCGTAGRSPTLRRSSSATWPARRHSRLGAPASWSRTPPAERRSARESSFMASSMAGSRRSLATSSGCRRSASSPRLLRRVGDAEAADALAGALRPYADHNAQIGFAVLLGPVQLFVAMATAAAGRSDEAEERFREAIGRSEALGTLTAEVHARCGYGELLLARGDGRARDELARAKEMAERTGMAGCAARARKGLGDGG